MKLPTLISNLLKNEKIMKLFRYLVIGVLTTCVSFSIFWILCYPVKLDPNLANILSILCAIIFAYFTNKIFVFRSHSNSTLELLKEAISFVISRGFTILVEVGGVFLMVNILKLDPMLSKVMLSVIVIVLNYIISHFFVFKEAKS